MVMIDNEKAISEVLTILEQIDEMYRKKIPSKIMNELRTKSIYPVDYIKPNIPLEQLPLEEDTKEFLAILTYQYFCTPEEKKDWNQELKEKGKIQKKNNPKELFKNKSKDDNHITAIKTEKQMVNYKNSLFEKIKNKIKKLFYKREKIG